MGTMGCAFESRQGVGVAAFRKKLIISLKVRLVPLKLSTTHKRRSWNFFSLMGETKHFFTSESFFQLGFETK
jgi:hypothetical protein